MKSNQAFQNPGHFQKGTRPHAVGIVFEAFFPVGGAQIVRNRKKVKNLLDLSIADNSPNAHTAYVIARHHYLEAAGFDIEQIELLDRRPDRPAANLFDHAYPVVWIDHLIADVEI